MSKNTTQRTITASELQRLSFCNSPRLPRFVNVKGTRYEWVGIGWVPVGKARASDVRVVYEDEESET